MDNVIQLKIDKLKKHGTSRDELKTLLVPLVQWMSDHKVKCVMVEIPDTGNGIANVKTSVLMNPNVVAN